MDDHRTEAACLLETGARYRKRVGLEPAIGDGPLVFAGFKHGAFSLYFGDEPIYHFDLEGRWQRAYLDGLHYLKGLDAEVHEIDRVREGPNLVLRRRKLSYGEAADLDARLRSVALELMAGLARRAISPARAAGRQGDAPRQRRAARRPRTDRSLGYRRLVGPSRAICRRRTAPCPSCPRMPECGRLASDARSCGGPDVRAVCRRRAYVRSPEEFAQHTREVAALWGRRLLQSRLIFLAGDDVLHQPSDRSKPISKPSAGRFRSGERATDADLRFEGVHAFLDDFAGHRFGRDEWAGSLSGGLSRVSLGVESGDPAGPVCSTASTWVDEDLRATVAAPQSRPGSESAS